MQQELESEISEWRQSSLIAVTILGFVTEHLVIYIQDLTTILTGCSTLHIESDIFDIIHYYHDYFSACSVFTHKEYPGQKSNWPHNNETFDYMQLD